MRRQSDKLYTVYTNSLIKVGHFELQTATSVNVLTVCDPLVHTNQRIMTGLPP